MAYNGIMQSVIDTTSKKVKRWGFCDMNDNIFNDAIEDIVEFNFIFKPSIDKKEWVWNDATFVVGEDQSVKEYYHMMQQIDINKNSKAGSYKTLSRIIYLGTGWVGQISHIEAIAYKETGATSYDLRVVDKGNNSAIIAEVTGLVNTEDQIVDLGTVGDLPTSKTRFDVQIRVNDGGKNKKGFLDSILIKY